MSDRYLYTEADFRDDCYNGKDVEFSFKGKNYTALCWCDDGINVSEWGKEDTNQVFKDADDMLNNYMLDGVRFKDALPDIEVLLH